MRLWAVQVTVENEPLAVATCHCEFCQKRTGSVFQEVSVVFADDQSVTITGETKIYNGLEINGIRTANGDEVRYHFARRAVRRSSGFSKVVQPLRSRLASLPTRNSRHPLWSYTALFAITGCSRSNGLSSSMDSGPNRSAHSEHRSGSRSTVSL